MNLESLTLIQSIASPKKALCYFLTPANLKTDCRSAIIAITISYPWSLIACRHGWVRGGSPAIPYPRCRFASIYGAAKEYADSAAKTDRQHSDVARSFSLPFLPLCPSPFLAPPVLSLENLTFKLITQLLPPAARRARLSLPPARNLSLSLSFS